MTGQIFTQELLDEVAWFISYCPGSSGFPVSLVAKRFQRIDQQAIANLKAIGRSRSGGDYVNAA